MFKKVVKILLIVILAVIFFRAILVIAGVTGGDEITGNKVAVITYDGEIFSSNFFIKELKKLNDNKNVKGIIIRVNSPGGAVTPSMEIYDYILSIDKPVYVSMGSVAASGGYLISLAANKIFAMPTTVTGSIGVIMNLVNAEELLNKIGIKLVTLKSGQFKDIGNPDRPMTEEEKQVLMAVINDMYEKFVAIVSTRRNLPIEDVKKIADGRILTGSMAKDLSLVDNLGTYRDAFIDMSHTLNIPGLEMHEIEKKETLIDKLLGEVSVIYNKNKSDIGIYYLLQ